MTSVQSSIGTILKKRNTWLCACFALATAIVPFARAFFRVEVGYNEGWNIYNANIVANHQLLYPVKYGWTTINYPMLSFFLMAQLHRVTHDYLFTARILSILSLIGCSVLVAAIVRKLTGSRTSSLLAGFYCLALFCTDADPYVGVDDPQMFSLVFFLLGFFLYLWRRQSLLVIAGAALLFVVGGCIKHNPIDFPLAVLLELTLISLRRALWFAVWGLVFAGAAVALNIHYGGPYFLSQLFAPRAYSVVKSFDQVLTVFGPLLLPFCVALYMAFIVRRDPQRRIVAVLLATSVILGGYFGGGHGVSINAFFSALLVTAILFGLFCAEIESASWQWSKLPMAGDVPLLLFGWLVIPWLISGNLNPVSSLRETAAAESRFDQQVRLLHSQPGPALCESLLRCYFAGKPYLYDPFNATRLIQFRKIDPAFMVEQVREQTFGAIQLDGPIKDEADLERFDPSILSAIQNNYVTALDQEDGIIYVPKHAQPSSSQPSSAPLASSPNSPLGPNR